MYGVTFGAFHSYDDLHLILNQKEIGIPEIKKNEVDVEGADGKLDYTEYFGEVKYSNRPLKFGFSIINQANFLTSYSDIQDKLHGKKVHIILDEEPGYYYVGRLSISPYTNEKGIGKISIECDCEPYKKKTTETVVTRTVDESATITLVNSRQRVVPQITASAAMTFTFEGSTYSVSAGTFIIPGLELKEGNNTITVTGNGTVSFAYREGRL